MTIDLLALARECGFEFYPDADGNIDDDLFTGSRKELIAFGNAIIERCAANLAAEAVEQANRLRRMLKANFGTAFPESFG